MFDSKSIAADIVKSDKALTSGGAEPEPSGLEACCQDLMAAFQENDPKALAAAFQACFDACESSPHDEASESPEEDASAGE
jgi:hypothetical protein